MTSLPSILVPKALLRLTFACALLMSVVGCHNSVTIGGDDGGADAARPDSGADAARPDSGDVACGPSTCTGGQVCCNASCGICADPGDGCIAIGCELTCGAEICGGSGSACCAGCEGEEFCPALDGTCPLLSCPPPPMDCGGFGRPCGAEEYCDYSDGCGFDDGSGVCEPRPGGCTADCPGVCGCDGRTYCNACVAAAAGVDVAPDGTCAMPPLDCSPDDARGEGACEAIVGVAWDGARCVALSGCSCAGADCGKYVDVADCTTRHTSCATPPSRSCAGFGGTCDADEFCDAPTASCGAAGICEPRPSACPDIFAPVCGCDGRDYDNECAANSAGTTAASMGSCAAP